MGLEHNPSHETEPIVPVAVGDVIRFDRHTKPISHSRDHLVVESKGDAFEALALPPKGADAPYGLPGTEFESRGGYEKIGRFETEDVVIALARSIYGGRDISDEELQHIRRSIA